jgi:hypothetical protein
LALEAILEKPEPSRETRATKEEFEKLQEFRMPAIDNQGSIAYLDQ